ncbi:LXG domain-containing protein, partial [Fictibacillus sp. Mic-4]|uniref:T7SS effector LXG polymorphic toxin n=1 Tax=Fictibacillus sp. Mic-4 TaxID=3132826 RepID=UPI003CE859F2
MKVLDVSEVLDGIDRWVEKKEQEKEQVHAIREAMEKVIELDDNLKGRGGEAIKKHFASNHLPIINEWLQFLDDYTNRLNGIKNEILDFETNEAIIREDFLEHDIKNGLDKLARFTHDKVNEINEAFFSISDLIGGAPISTAEFDSEIHNSGRYLHETIHQLRDLDEKSVSKVTSAANQLDQLIQLMENKRRPTKSGTLLKQNADNPFIAFAEGLGDILPFNVWADSIVHPVHTLEEMWKAWKKEVMYGNAVSRAAFFGKLIGNYHFMNEVISNVGSSETRLTKEEQEVDNLLKKFKIADKI